MKRNVCSDSLLGALTGRIQSKLLNEIKSFRERLFISTSYPSVNNPRLRSLLFVLFLLFSSLPSIAPDRNYLIIFYPVTITPFEPLMYAIGMVETMGNTLAYNEFENAVGIFQIRQIKLDEYNRQTRGNYKLEDMFDLEISRKVFLHFASQIGPYNFEKIAKAWNGSGPMTDFYWRRIKSYL